MWIKWIGDIVESCGGAVPFISLVTAIIGAVVAIVTAVFAVMAILAGNKQTIFEERMDVYSIIKDFYDAYETSNYSNLNGYVEKFKSLTGGTDSLAEITDAIIGNQDANEKLPKKSFEIKKVSESIDMLWKRRRVFARGGWIGIHLIKKHKPFVDSARYFVESYMATIILLDKTYGQQHKYDYAVSTNSNTKDAEWAKLRQLNDDLKTHELCLEKAFNNLENGHFNKLKDSIRL